jgi:cation/acetate symporter
MAVEGLLLLAESDPARPWTWLFVGLTFGLYLLIGWLSRVRDTRGFYVAGQGVPAFANGAATAAYWMSAASFLSMAGLISFSGSDGSVYLMGWTGGYVLLALLLAPYLRKFGHYTVPDFIGERYYSETARVVAAVCAVFVSLTYVAGQMKGVGIVFSRFLEVELWLGVVIGMGIVSFFAVLGGMKGITWTQVVQYFVLILAFIIPSVAISGMLTGDRLPQSAFTFGDVSSRLNEVLAGLGEELYTRPFTRFSRLNVFLITAALMFGTAGLPHVIVRFYTVRSVRAARYSAVWAIVFIAILYTSAPALGMFARYNLIQSLHESRITSLELGNDQGTAQFTFPDQQAAAWQALRQASQDTRVTYFVQSRQGVPLNWATRWQNTGLLVFDDWNRDGTISLKLMDQTDPTGRVVRRSELAKIDKDIIVLSTPEVANLPPWVIALVAAGGLAAALSTAAGLLLVISSSLAHDLYMRFARPRASEAEKVLMGRIAIVFGILVAGYFGINPPGFVGEVVAFAFGLAAASFFPAIFLGIFVRRVNRAGAVAGMVAGLSFTMLYIVLCTADKVLPMFCEKPPLAEEDWWLGISPQGIGTLGMLLNFVVTLTISWLTPPPPQAVQELVEDVRTP